MQSFSHGSEIYKTCSQYAERKGLYCRSGKRVKNPSWTEKDGLLHIFKREENKVLHVVGKEETHNVYKVITLYYDRRKK